MRVMIDYSQIPVSRTGVGVYAENLVREIVPLFGPNDSLFVLLQSDEIALPQDMPNGHVVQYVVIPSRFFRNRAILFAFEQLILPLLLMFYRIDSLHSLHYTHPILSPCRRIVTIHDLTFLLFPDLHTRGRRLIMPFFIRHAIRHSDAVIFVSESTRKDAERLVARGNAVGVVVPLGVDPKYSVPSGQDEISAVLKKLNLSRPFILNIGTIEPRKNLVRLVQAFEYLADRRGDVSLVLAGKLGWDYSKIITEIRRSRHTKRLLQVGFITDDEKRVLLNSCEIFVYPSLYEGFGLPVLEAMAAGVPVITSANSSLSEVAGDTAELVDPTSIQDLANAMVRILADDSNKDKNRAAGKSRASSFTWMNTARETYRLYTTLNKHTDNNFRA